MLEIRNLMKTYRDKKTNVQAIQGINLSVAEGEFLVLLGSSGCGKTTTLRAIAGLEFPDDGEIRIDGSVVYSSKDRIAVSPERRPISMVFQSYAIWPHMNVYENIAFPLRSGVRRVEKGIMHQRIMEVLEVLGLESMADRPVTTLSGGQQQRVALARAIALQPKVLLMDEPLSNLDFKLRARLRIELKELMQRLNLTTIYVTHDQTEALEMGDRIAVMHRGKIEQLADPRTIYESPATEYVARFIGDMNFISGTVKEINADKVLLQTAESMLTAMIRGGGSPAAGDRWLLGIRPEDIRIQQEPFIHSGSANVLKGTVISSQYLGDINLYRVAVNEIVLLVKCHHSQVVNKGQEVFVYLDERYSIAVQQMPEVAPAKEAKII